MASFRALASCMPSSFGTLVLGIGAAVSAGGAEVMATEEGLVPGVVFEAEFVVCAQPTANTATATSNVRSKVLPPSALRRTGRGVHMFRARALAPESIGVRPRHEMPAIASARERPDTARV